MLFTCSPIAGGKLDGKEPFTKKSSELFGSGRDLKTVGLAAFGALRRALRGKELGLALEPEER